MPLARPGLRFGAVLLLLASLVLPCGCRQEEPALPDPVPKETATPTNRPQPRVLVPEEVAGAWETVSIAVLDKTTGTEEAYTVEIGSSVRLPDSEIRLEVLTFLPHFIMDGRVMTSASAETKNPAAQVMIHDGEQPVFQGWLFSLYPGTHAFQHPRYSFTLIDFAPAQKRVDNPIDHEAK